MALPAWVNEIPLSVLERVYQGIQEKFTGALELHYSVGEILSWNRVEHGKFPSRRKDALRPICPACGQRAEVRADRRAYCGCGHVFAPPRGKIDTEVPIAVFP